MASEIGDAEAPTRSSGRVRKRPETFYDTSPGPSSSKRRRGDDVDHEPDYQDLDESADGEDQEDDTYAGDALPARTKTTIKPLIQKKPRTNGTTTLPIRGAGAGAGAGRKKTNNGLNGIDASAAGGIFAEIFAENKDVQEVVSQWLQRFAKHESSALSEIISFVLRAAGCTSSVSVHDIEDPDAATSVVADLMDEFQASNPTEYPLMATKGRTATTVKQGVAKFIDVLSKSIAANGMLYDNPELLENVHVWFATMSTAANRPFRHTSTVVSLLCATALCETARDLETDASRIQRQAETERKKKTNSARVSGIEQKVEEAHGRFEFVKDLVKDWYDTVFIHRYKDVDAAIRRECAAALGDWITLLPSVYLDGQHLRYLGWMLSDAQHSVRHEAVKQILRFYKGDMIGGLKTFTERFRPRLVEMATSDAEATVRTASIELLDHLRDNGLLEPDDIDAVGRLIFEYDDKVRKATARFLAEGIKELYEVKIDELGGQAALDELPTPEGYDTPRLEWLKLKCLAETLQAYHNEDLPRGIDRARLNGELILNVTSVESRYSLAASDLRSKIEEVQDWQLLAGYLLYEAPSKTKRKTNDLGARLQRECSLSSEEEAILLDVLLVSARYQFTTLAETLSTPKGRKNSDAEDLLEEAARYLLLTLPKLLERYGGSQESSSVILRLQQNLDLEAVQNLGLTSSSYDELLEQTKRQFLSHTHDEVLDLAIQTISRAKLRPEFEDIASEKLSEIWEAVVLDFVQLINFANINKRGATPDVDLRALSDNLLRMIRLASISDPTTALEDKAPLSKIRGRGSNQALIDCMLSLMQRGKHGSRNTTIDKLEDKIAQSAAEVALFYFRWRFVSIKQRVSAPNGVNIDGPELTALAEHRDTYVECLAAILQLRKAKDDISAVCAGLQIDLHMSAGTLAAVDRDPDVLDDYTIFILPLASGMPEQIMKAFAGAEAAYADLAKKHLEPSAELDDFDEDPESDEEEDEESQSQAVREAKMTATLLAEARLCQLTSKIVTAVLAEYMDKGPTRQRVEKNKQKLGNNFKEVCKYFDLDSKKIRKPKPKVSKSVAAATNGASKARGRARKNNAIDADTEDEDEIEDDEAEVRQRRELVDIDDEMDE